MGDRVERRQTKKSRMRKRIFMPSRAVGPQGWYDVCHRWYPTVSPWRNRRWGHYGARSSQAPPGMLMKGPSWTCGWGIACSRQALRTSERFLARLRSGRHLTSPVVAVELLMESTRYANLTFHEQAAVLRDVVQHYGPGKSR